MILERSPNHLVSRIFPETVLKKPDPDLVLVNQAVNNLPLLKDEFVGIVGVGDYDCRKSSGGSVVLGYEKGIVMKVPLGDGHESAFSRARRMQNSLDNFKDFSPDTMVIIAKADGNDPKPIVIQTRIIGKPLCEAPLSSVFRLKTLRDIRTIVSKMKNWYWKKGSYDLCGQRTANTFLGRIVQFAPMFSDNIMIDQFGHAFLTDNILDSTVKMDTPKRRYRDFLRKNLLHNIPLLVIDSLIFARKAYNLLTRNTEPMESVSQMI